MTPSGNVYDAEWQGIAIADRDASARGSIHSVSEHLTCHSLQAENAKTYLEPIR